MNKLLATGLLIDIEEFLFHDDIVYSKLNKKALDVLVRSGALTQS